MRYTPALISALALAFASSPAAAQNALGDGRALDSNLQSGTNGRNAPARNLMREFQLRNAIVTGQAPGGLSFRGDVGYTAADDFRAEVAEDTLFTFDRDSFRSGLTARGARGVDALKLQMQLTIGGFVGQGEYLPTTVTRGQSGSSASRVENRLQLNAQFGSNDPLAFRDGSLRATTEFLAHEADTPVLLRVIQDEDESTPDQFAVATPLRAVATQTTLRHERRLSDMLEATERENNRVDDQLTPSERVSNQLESESTVYDSILDRLLGEPDEDGDDPLADPALDDAADPLLDPALDPAADPAAIEEPEHLVRLREMRDALMSPDVATPEYGGSEDEDPTATEELRRRIAESAKSIFEGSVVQVDEIAPPINEAVNLYADHMARGQAFLHAGRWFAAEERFTSALGIKPGDPMAAAGRVNAQIGGGMFLSAGMNLQKLFRAHPELINVRYGEDLLPSGARLTEVVALLTSRMRGEDDFARGAALVHAYLGFQSADAERISEGLSRVEAIDTAAGRQPDTLLAVLKTAWGV